MKEKLSSGKGRKYDASFGEEVVKMVLSGRPVTEVAQSLGIGENLIYRSVNTDWTKGETNILYTSVLFC